MKYFAIILIAMAWFSFTQGYIHKKGYCVWYDECLRSSDGAALNCLYNGPAKRLNDTKGLTLLHKLCPRFSQEQPMTCCSTKQLITLEKTLDSFLVLTRPCPSCWQNILDMFCEITCSPDQSLFVSPDGTVGFPPMESILRVTSYFSMSFKTDLYESCGDVFFRETRPFSEICRKSPKTCPPQQFLEYLGSTSSGYVNFDILFPDILPSNMTWINGSTHSCNESYVNPWTNKTFDKCPCIYCQSSCGDQARNISRNPYDSPNYRKAVLRVTANSTYPQNHTGYYRYPDDKFIPFGPIFHLDLLNQALDLQLALANMKVPYTKNNKTVDITLDDVCYKPPSGKKCVIESVFQYFQNNRTLLNRCLTALGFECGSHAMGFFKADYHDHFLYCTSFPFSPNDEKWGGGPCLGENGIAFRPRYLLSGFNNTDYNTAKYLVISFVFKNHTEISKNEMARAWEKAFLSYMMEYVQNPRHSNLTITFSAAASPDHGKSTSSPATTIPTTSLASTVPDIHSGSAGVSLVLGQLVGIALAVVMLVM